MCNSIEIIFIFQIFLTQFNKLGLNFRKNMTCSQFLLEQVKVEATKYCFISSTATRN